MDSGNLHGPRMDDELKHEVESLTRGTPLESRVEPERLMQDSGDDEPPVQPIVHERDAAEAGDETRGALSTGEMLARTDLAVHLRPGIFPASRQAILECAREQYAPPSLLGQLTALPDRRYDTVGQVWEALGGQHEERSAALVGTAADANGDDEPVPPTPTRARQATERFEFRFDRWYRLAALAFDVRPDNAFVEVDPVGGRMVARFGHWVVDTTLDNIRSTAVSGPYGTLKTIGPAHVSLVDGGLTFATNRERGLCVTFATAVPGIAPTSRLRHRGLTVTVDDVEGLARALRHGARPRAG